MRARPHPARIWCVRSYGHVKKPHHRCDLRHAVRRIQGYVPKPYFDVTENVCRWGQSAGTAGEALGFGNRGGEVRAHQIVCFVSDIIVMKENLA